MAGDLRLPPRWADVVELAAAEHWKGSSTFPQRIAEAVAKVPALETLWRLGAVDVDDLVERYGSALCGIDAARARGEFYGGTDDPCHLEPSDGEVLQKTLNDIPWAKALETTYPCSS